MGQYDNYDARGWDKVNYYDDAQPYNEKLNPNNPDYGKSLAYSVGHYDPRNMMRPDNLTQDLGASTYQAPPPATVYPGQRNIHEGFGTANVSTSFPPPQKTGILQTIGNWGKGIMDNSIVGSIASGFDATDPRSGNYNPALQGQIDYMQANKAYGTNATSGLPQITGGVLAGQNLQSGFGSNDLGAMYEKSLARTQKTIDNFGKQWGHLKEEDEDAYNAKLQVHLNRKKKKEDEFSAFQAAQNKAADDRIAIEHQRAGTAPQRREGKGGTHMSRSRDQGGLGISQSQAQSISDANRAAGMSGWGLAQGGRAGYRGGEFVDENINVEGPNFDFNENIEMAETSPFEMRIQELMDTGMSWQEAYQIASQEFGQVVEGESDQGIASLV